MSDPKYIDADEFWDRLISVSENDWVGFDTIDEVLSGMPAEPRWISVTEGLPAYGEAVLLSMNGKYGLGYLVPTYDERRYEWHHSGWFYFFNEVDAWMPLPTPYKGGEE